MSSCALSLIFWERYYSESHLEAKSSKSCFLSCTRRKTPLPDFYLLWHGCSFINNFLPKTKLIVKESRQRKQSFQRNDEADLLAREVWFNHLLFSRFVSFQIKINNRPCLLVSSCPLCGMLVLANNYFNYYLSFHLLKRKSFYSWEIN